MTINTIMVRIYTSKKIISHDGRTDGREDGQTYWPSAAKCLGLGDYLARKLNIPSTFQNAKDLDM